MCIHMCVCMCVCSYIHTQTHTCICICVCVCVCISSKYEMYLSSIEYISIRHTHTRICTCKCVYECVCDICMYVFKTLIQGNPKQHACMSIFACSFVYTFTRNMCSQHQSSMHKHEPLLSALMMAAFPCSSKFSEVASATGIK